METHMLTIVGMQSVNHENRNTINKPQTVGMFAQSPHTFHRNANIFHQGCLKITYMSQTQVNALQLHSLGYDEDALLIHAEYIVARI